MRQRERWLGALALVLFIWTPVRLALQPGMFVDGMTGAVLARNLSQGLGTLWRPFYTATNAPVFEGHPPLTFWMQSVWYTCLGDRLWVDGLHSLALGLLTALAIGWSWRSTSSHVFWALLLAMCTPLLVWSLSNNMLENTVSLFAILAIGSYQRGFVARRGGVQAGWWIVGSAGVLLAWWSKGPVGLFPLAVPLWWWLSHQMSGLSANGFWRSVLGIGLGLVLVSGLWVLSFPASIDFVERYVAVQLSPALQNELHVTTPYRAHILWVALQQLVIPTVIGVTLLIIGQRRRIAIPRIDRQMAIFWGWVAISAILPLMLTLKQRRFYLVPAVWASVIGWSYATAPVVSTLLAAIPKRSWRLLTRAIVVAALLATLFTLREMHDLERDISHQELAAELSQAVPAHTTIGVSEAAATDWRLHAYLMRYGWLSIGVDDGAAWQLRRMPTDALAKGWEVAWQNEDWVLYKRMVVAD